MSSCIIDSSIAISWIRPEQATPATIDLLGQVEAGLTIVVPSLWFTEIANTLLVLQRRKRLHPKDRKIALETLSAFRLIMDDASARSAFDATSDLAEAYDLTVYDATYLELALRRKIDLATRDGKLRQAAEKCGVTLI